MKIGEKKITDSKIFYVWCKLFLSLLNTQIPRDNTEETTLQTYVRARTSHTLKNCDVHGLAAFQCPEFEKKKKEVGHILAAEANLSKYWGAKILISVIHKPSLWQV